MKALYNGTSDFKKILLLSELPKKIDIYLETNIESLGEVVVTASQKQVRTDINKLIYTVRKNDFVKNTKALKIINNIPSLSYNDLNGVKIDGNKDAHIYIDGIESNIQDLNSYNTEDINKVEVISGASARYGSELNGGIVNVITKNNKEDIYYKGAVSIDKGLLNQWTSIYPTISYKNRKMIVKGIYSYLDNKQKVNYEMKRYSSDNDNYFQKSYREPNVNQQYGNVNFKYLFNEVESIYLRSTYFSYEINGLINGSYGESSFNDNDFINDSRNSYSNLNMDGVYERKFKNTNKLYLKAKYKIYNKEDFFDIIDNEINDTIESNLVKSDINEFTGEIDYELNDFKVFNQQSNVILGSKYINREFSNNTDSFKLNQNIYSVFTDISSSFNDDLSFFLSLYYEYTKNANINQDYTNFLPTATVNYKVGQTKNLEATFERKIIRPNTYDLNAAPVYINPGTVEVGNENLLPEIKNTYSLKFSRVKKNTYLSLKGYYEELNDAIYQSVDENNGALVYSKHNIGEVKKYGLIINASTQVFNFLNTNSTVGLVYNKLDSNIELSDNSVTNSGTMFVGSLYLSTMIKEKVTVSLLGSYTGPTYDFVSKTTLYPYTTFSVSSNFFKDKLTVGLNYSDLFKLNSKRKTVIQNNSLYQNININNNSSNITISLTYNFGKYFNDRYNSNVIKNNDMRGN